jgi:hypothetical protein
MNKAYEVIDNNVMVYDEFYHISSRKYTNNIEDVLVTENNIEEIERLIKEETQKKKDINLMEAVVPAYMTLSISRLISSIFKFITHEIEVAFIRLFSSICFFVAAYFTGIKKFIERRKIGNTKLDFLNEKLVHEKEKLNELNKDETNDLMFVETDKKTINKSVQIDILKVRLMDIKLFVENKNKFIKLYKKGILKNTLSETCVSNDSINFIIELIENDLNKKDEKKLGNQKKLKRS